MPTSFSLTFDSFHDSLVLITGEEILADVTELRITKVPNGAGYECEVTRSAGGTPVKLVAAASPIGRQLLRANGRESVTVPGFVEVSPSNLTLTVSSLHSDIAKYLSREA